MATKRIPICRRQICTEIDPPTGSRSSPRSDKWWLVYYSGWNLFFSWVDLLACIKRQAPVFVGVKYCHSTLPENVGRALMGKIGEIDDWWSSSGSKMHVKGKIALKKISCGPKRQYLKTIKFSHPWPIFLTQKGKKTTPKESTKPEKKVALFFSYQCWGTLRRKLIPLGARKGTPIKSGKLTSDPSLSSGPRTGWPWSDKNGK